MPDDVQPLLLAIERDVAMIASRVFGAALRASVWFMAPTLLVSCVADPAARSPSPEPCPADEIRDDTDACVPLACGKGEYGQNAGADVLLHPGESIQDAADSLGAGTLALAAGTYTESLVLAAEHDGITISGRCAALVTLDGAAGDLYSGTVSISARATHTFALSGLRITGGQAFGIAIDHALVDLRNLDVDGNGGIGIALTTATTTMMNDVLVRNSGVVSGEKLAGQGIVLGGTSHLVANRLTVQNNRVASVYLAEGTAEFTDLVITDTQPPTRAGTGFGMMVGHGATVGIDGGFFSQNQGYGLTVYGEGSVLTFTDLTIADTVATGTEDASSALLINQAGHVEGSGLTLARNNQRGIEIDSATAVLANVTVLDTDSGRINDGPAGVIVGGPSVVAISNLRVERASTLGVAAVGVGAELTIAGCDVGATRPNAGGDHGVGIVAGGGAHITVRGCAIHDNAEAGVLVVGAGSRVDVSDSVIGRTAASPAGDGYGHGAFAQDAASLTLSDVLVRDATGSGIGATLGASVTLTDVTVARTRTLANGDDGKGIVVDGASTLLGAGVAVVGNRSVGIYVLAGSSAEFEDCVVSGTRADTSGTNGLGAWVAGGSHLKLERCALTDNELGGVLAADVGTQVDLMDVTVSEPYCSPFFGFGGGIEAATGARVVARRLRIDDPIGFGLLVDQGGVMEIDDVVVRRTRGVPGTDDVPEGVGAAVMVAAGSTLTGRNLEIDGGATVGLLVAGENSFAGIDGFDAHHLTATTLYATTLGASAQQGGVLTLTDAMFVDVEGVALLANAGGLSECRTCVITGAAFAGAASLGGSLILDEVAIADTRPDASFGGGVGIFASNGDVARDAPGSVSVDRSTISDNPIAGLWLHHVESVVVRDSVIRGGEGFSLREGLSVHGNAIYARDLAADAPGLVVSNSSLGGSDDAGVLLDDASATFTDVEWGENGVDVVQQRCGESPVITELSGATTEICDGRERPALSLVFDVYLTEVVGVLE